MNSKIIELTAEITVAYISNNAVPAEGLVRLIESVFSALIQTDSPANPAATAALTPAVPIHRSVQPDFIICLEDGKQFKSLKRHLQTKYGLTPPAYRKKWGLPQTYPMVAPNYAAARSALAKASGLGAGGRAGKPVAPTAAVVGAPVVGATAPDPAPVAKIAKAPHAPKANAKSGPGAMVTKAKLRPKAINPATDDFT